MHGVAAAVRVLRAWAMEGRRVCNSPFLPGFRVLPWGGGQNPEGSGPRAGGAER